MMKVTISTHLLRVVQAVWAVALLGLLTPVMIGNRGLTVRSSLYIASFVAYIVATFGIFLDYRWAWAVSMGFLAVYWVHRGWIGLANFVVNIHMFLTGHELYYDSPATILIVGINALFGIVPATTLLVLAFISRRHILGVLKGGNASVAQPRTPGDGQTAPDSSRRQSK